VIFLQQLDKLKKHVPDTRHNLVLTRSNVCSDERCEFNLYMYIYTYIHTCVHTYVYICVCVCLHDAAWYLSPLHCCFVLLQLHSLVPLHLTFTASYPDGMTHMCIKRGNWPGLFAGSIWQNSRHGHALCSSSQCASINAGSTDRVGQVRAGQGSMEPLTCLKMHSRGSLRAAGHLPQGALAWDTHLLGISKKLTALTSQHTSCDSMPTMCSDWLK